MQENLRKKAGLSPETQPSKTDDKPTEKPAENVERPGDKKVDDPTKTDDKPQDVTKPETKAEVAQDPKKVSPWKLVDQFKQRLAQTEKELADTKASIVPEAERKQFTDRLDRAEKRAAELEDEMRFVNYAKSKEFQEKHQAPYEGAWKRAMSELSEIAIEDPQTHQRRAVTSNDLMELVNLPLGKAREIAQAVFGDFANDVLAHRKEIKTLFESQNAALEEAKTKGAEREQLRKEQYFKLHGAVSQQTREIWDKVNTTLLEDPAVGSLFKHRESDDDWNQRLTKGFELVDKAFSENPMDPRMSQEQRTAVVKRHAAVRNRAAGWGALKVENDKLRKQLSELEGDLKKYKESTPQGGGTQPASTSNSNGNARDSMIARIQKIARPL